MPISETLQICAPCRNGDHYYCVMNQYRGLAKVYDSDYLHPMKLETCFCGCAKR